MKSFAVLCAAVACLFAAEPVESGVINSRIALSFNSVADKLIAKLHNNAASMGFDPYNIPNVDDTFKLGLIKGGLFLDNGKLYGINTVFRAGNVTANLASGTATVNASLGFQDLSYKFDFAAKLGILGPKGKVHGDITQLYVDAVVLANMKNTSDVTLSLQSLKLKDKGYITVHFENKDVVAEDLLNVLTDTFTKIFRDVIVNVLQKKVQESANSALKNAHFDLNSLTN